MNLVKFILNLILSGDALGKLTSLLGTDLESTKKAATASVPAILSGLAGLASTDDGARKLASTFNGLDTSTFGNLAKMLGGDTSSLANKGTSLLGSLFGDSLVTNIANSVGKYAGLDASVTKKLIGMIAPTVLSTVASQWKDQGGGIGALTSLLTSQQKNIAAALPSGFSLASIPGLPTAEAAMHAAGQTVRAAGAHTADVTRRTAHAAEDTSRTFLQWLVPLAAVLLLGLGLWYLFGRQPVQVAKNAANATADVAKDAGRATAKAVNDSARAAGEAVTALRPELPAIPDVSLVTKDLTGIFTSATQTLGNIRDAASAQAALPRINELSSKIDGIRDQFDGLPAAGQAALGQLISKQYGPLQEQVARILEMPGINDQVKLALSGITNKLAALNLAQVSKDATNIFTTLTNTLNGFRDAASAEAAVPQLEDVSAKLDDLKQVQSHMSPGGQSMLSKLVTAARGTLDQLIAGVLSKFGVDAVAIKPVLDSIVNKLAALEQPNVR